MNDPTIYPLNSNSTGKGVCFERIRRITGYLVGTMDKWSDAKRAEESERVKHKFEMEDESNG